MNPETLKNYRKLYRLTQKELACELCVTLRSVQSWENGSRSMPAGYEKLFCLLHGLPFDQRKAIPSDVRHPDLF